MEVYLDLKGELRYYFFDTFLKYLTIYPISIGLNSSIGQL